VALRYAYNTNGTANHRFEDSLALIADSGYDGVALTLDHHHFDPFAPELSRRAEALGRELQRLKLGLVLETGARYLLDARRKHEPTLVSPEPEGRARRVEFLWRAMQIAAACGAEAVSFWAGVVRQGVAVEDARAYLRAGVSELVERNADGVALAFEPEPGMLVEDVADFLKLQRQVPQLRLALDTGHCIVSGGLEPADAIHQQRHNLATVSLEDMPRGKHEHLPFGEGDMDLPAVLRALRDVGYSNLACVELSRDSHRAHSMVPQALAYLRNVERQL
jgi:sugar phosphate isomerase/epimerase